MAGNQKLLLNQLKRFVKSQNCFEEKILTHVKNSDLESAIREAHTLKGLCGNIGADLLFEKAKELEFHLKEKGFDNKYAELIKNVEFDLNILIQNIKAVIELFLSKEDRSAINRDRVDELFNQLEIIKANLDNIPLLLNDFRQQVLTKAVVGDLTGKNGQIDHHFPV